MQFLSARQHMHGILIHVTNPKVAIFLLTFLLQFTTPPRGSISMQTIMLGMIFMVTMLIIFSGIARSAGHIDSGLIRSSWARVHINRFAGTVFILPACRLALNAL